VPEARYPALDQARLNAEAIFRRHGVGRVEFV
jgi:hypothetical protein